jgi:hypothetical protein
MNTSISAVLVNGFFGAFEGILILNFPRFKLFSTNPLSP